MFKKIFLITIGLSGAVFADDLFIDYYPIYVYGDTGIYKMVFNAMAMIFQYQPFVDFVTTVVSVLAFIAMIFRIVYKYNSAGGGEANTDMPSLVIKQFIFITLIMVIFLNPALKSQVTIIDKRLMHGTANLNGNQTKIIIDNIPTALALTASFSSYLGSAIIDMVDSAFTSINGVRYGDMGFMKNFEAIGRENAERLGKTDDEIIFVNMLRNYLQDCAFRYADDTDDKSVIRNTSLGRVSLEGLNPANLRYPQVMASYRETSSGLSCTNYFIDIEQKLAAIAPDFQNRAIRRLWLEPNTSQATLDALGKNLNAMSTNVATATANIHPFIQYQLKATMDETVASAHYADALGLSGANAAALNANVQAAFAKMTDITSQGGFLFSAQTLPDVLHIMIACVYSVFPFVFITAVIQGYPKGLEVVKGYVVSLIFVEYCRMCMALAHNIVTYYTSQNAATILHGLAGGNINPNDIVHGIQYYEYMAKQATLAANIGTSFAIVGPALIATGKMMQWLSQALTVSQAPSMGGIKEGHEAISKSSDAIDRNASEGLASMGVIKGIEDNNAALASFYKTANLQDYSKGQIGQEMQKIGNTAGFGSELNSANDFNNVGSGGKFQGVQQAAATKSLGEVFEGTQTIQMGNHKESVSGDSLARTLGNDSTMRSVGAARGLMGSLAYNKEGEVANNAESAKYTQGLENQSRFQANQTMGLGKIGALNTDQMNAIQYASHAQGLGQIEQGQSLRRAYGTGASFASNYARDAATMADMKNLSDRATAAAARDDFGDVAGGHGRDSIKHTSQNLASLSNASNIGKSQGFDTLRQEFGATDAKAAFVNTSDIQTQAQGKGQILKDKEATEMAKSSLRNEYDMSNMDELNEKIRRANANYEQNLENNKQFAREQMRNTGSFGTRLAATVGLYEEKEFQRQLSQVNAEMGTREDFENHVSGLKSQYQSLQTQHVQKGMQGFNSSSSQADILAKSESMQFVQTAASVSAMTSQGGMAAGSIASGGGTLTSAGHSAIGIQAAERTGSIMAANNLYNNSAAISSILTDAGASQAQIASVLSARNPVERANRMQAVISSHNLRGSVNGRSFSLTLSADGQYSGSFDSSLNVYGGYRVDMGDASAAAGYAAGGVTGMRTVGVINTANNFVQNSFQNVAFYAPGGSVAKLGTNTGFISSNSRYGMGVGKYNQQMATQGIRQEASFGNGVGGGEVTSGIGGNGNFLSQ